MRLFSSSSPLCDNFYQAMELADMNTHCTVKRLCEYYCSYSQLNTLVHSGLFYRHMRLHNLNMLTVQPKHADSTI